MGEGCRKRKQPVQEHGEREKSVALRRPGEWRGRPSEAMLDFGHRLRAERDTCSDWHRWPLSVAEA